ncbi:hypothetical protein [Thalassoglobus sp.]|uniref:hypothetical protein n=1 Tax=Thalassoglobus sp. TaxID=2795869 RepID=UPI003AA943AE
MLRPSHVLAFVSAMLAAEASQTHASAEIQQSSQSAQSTSLPQEELTINEQIVYEARRQLGNELRKY